VTGVARFIPGVRSHGLGRSARYGYVPEVTMLTPRVTYLGPSHGIRLSPPAAQDTRRR